MDESARVVWDAAQVTGERRCQSCGGLAALDAEWCGQCLAALRPGPSPSRREPGELSVSEPVLMPRLDGVRGGEDASANARAVAPRTDPFGDPPAPAPREQVAVATPGGGGLGVSGGTASWDCPVCGERNTFDVAVCLISRSGRLGSFLPLFLLYLASAAALYVVSAVDAGRVASGRAPAVSSRALSWMSAALVLVSIVMAAFVDLPTTRG